jgi:N-methylhydantoinase B
MRRDYYFPDDPATFTVLSDRDIAGPHGLFGGLPGSRARYILNPDGGTSPQEALKSKCVVQLQPGDTLSFQTPGGGGYGPPHERDPELVLRDVLDGKVSTKRARELYKVAVNVQRGQVDRVKTAKLRAATENGVGK